MHQEQSKSFRNLFRPKVLATVGLLTIAVLLFLLLGGNDAMRATILRIRALGPWIFFVSMAILPAFGFPLLAFTLAAGPVFGSTLGSGPTALYSILALITNLCLSYWIASKLRPVTAKLVRFLGYELPILADKSSAWKLVAVLRLTPGPPYWVQSYVLALLHVAFLPYLLVSTIVVSGYIIGLVYFGDAMTKGQGKNAFFALLFVGLLGTGIYFLRKRLAKTQA